MKVKRDIKTEAQGKRETGWDRLIILSPYCITWRVIMCFLLHTVYNTKSSFCVSRVFYSASVMALLNTQWIMCSLYTKVPFISHQFVERRCTFWVSAVWLHSQTKGRLYRSHCYCKLPTCRITKEGVTYFNLKYWSFYS